MLGNGVEIKSSNNQTKNKISVYGNSGNCTENLTLIYKIIVDNNKQKMSAWSLFDENGPKWPIWQAESECISTLRYSCFLTFRGLEINL